jgi:hypothetical protein
MARDERTPQSGEYEKLKERVREVKGRPIGPTDRERADWAYGNTKMENSAITRDMARRAVESRKPR